MNKTFFNIFFYGIFTLAIGIILINIGFSVFGATLLLKQDYSNGILPPIEKALCGKPGCLKPYLKNQ